MGNVRGRTKWMLVMERRMRDGEGVTQKGKGLRGKERGEDAGDGEGDEGKRGNGSEE